jgi:hypothetical protein
MPRFPGTRPLAAATARLAVLLLSGLALLGASAPEPDREAVATLEAAFERRYACSLTGAVRIRTGKRGGPALERRLHVAAKRIGERVHTYAIFQEPQYVRGMAFLGVETRPGEEDEHFVYVPSLRRIRRIGGNLASDSFLGTDLTYHDFERQRVGDFDLTGAARDQVAGENVLRVQGRPRFLSTYDLFEYSIAVSDHAILESRYYRHAFAEAVKRVTMPREAMVQQGSCLVPQRIVVEDDQRDTWTELFVSPLLLDAALEDRLFTTTSLEANRPIPGLSASPGVQP